ncbi:hypothetical protein D3C78_1958050 [compost metagenome]
MRWSAHSGEKPVCPGSIESTLRVSPASLMVLKPPRCESPFSATKVYMGAVGTRPWASACSSSKAK